MCVSSPRHAWGGPHSGQSLIRERRVVELEEMGKEEEEEEEEKKKKKRAAGDTIIIAGVRGSSLDK